MKVPPTGLNCGVIGWARPSPFAPLPFGSLLFAFHLLRGSLVYPRPTWECLCSHLSFPQLSSHVPTNLQALTLTLPIKLIKMAKRKSASENPRGADSKYSPSSTPSPSPLGSWWPLVTGLAHQDLYADLPWCTVFAFH